MFKKLHKLVVYPFLVSFIAGFAVAMFALTLQFMWHYTDNLVGKGLGFWVIAEVMLYTSINIALMAFPLAILISTVMTFGNLGENYELTALKSAGISLKKTMTPLLVVVVVFTVGMYFFANNIVPKSQLKFRYLLHNINKKNPEINFLPGVFNNDIPGFTIRAGKINQQSGMMYHFLIYDHSANNGNLNVILADSAKLRFTSDEKNMILSLFHGQGYNEIPDTVAENNFNRQQRNTFDAQTLIYEIEGYSLAISDAEFNQKNYKTLNQKQLIHSADSLLENYQQIEKQYLASIISLTEGVDRSTAENKLAAMPQNEKAKLLDKTGTADFNAYVAQVKNELHDQMYDYKQYRISWHKKLSIPVSCLIFFLIGVPFGAIIRKGGVAISIAISMGLFVIYYMLTNVGEKLVRENTMNEILGMWFPSVIMLGLAIFILYKANNDSVYLNIETYTNLLKGKFKKR